MAGYGLNFIRNGSINDNLRMKRVKVGRTQRMHEYKVTSPPKSMMFCHQNTHFSTSGNDGGKNINGDLLTLNFRA
jgi:hypothetical protein